MLQQASSRGALSGAVEKSLQREQAGNVVVLAKAFQATRRRGNERLKRVAAQLRQRSRLSPARHIRLPVSRSPQQAETQRVQGAHCCIRALRLQAISLATRLHKGEKPCGG